MLGLILVLLKISIDALVLIFLLKTISDEDIDFRTAFILALAAAIGTAVLAFGLANVMGFAGIIVAVVVAAALLGAAVSTFFGVEIKRSFLIAVIFMVVHIGVGFGLQFLLST